MKKSLIALALLAASAMASAAGTITVEQEHFRYSDTKQFLNGTSILGSYDLGKLSLTIDGKHQFGKMNDGSSFNTNEVGLTKVFPLTDRTSFNLRGAVGRMYPQGGKTIAYELVDTTATYALLPGKLDVTGGYRFRDNTAGGFVTKSPMAWVDYHLTTKDTVTFGYTRILGALEASSTTMSYTRGF